MKQQIKNLIICLPLVGSWFAHGAPYDDDPQDFYVEGQSINSSLAQANAIICYMANMRPDQLVNDGNYKAVVYKDDCETSKKDATSEAASATATSSQSSTTASSGSSATGSQKKTAMTSILNVTRADGTAPVDFKVWVTDKAESKTDFSKKIYVSGQQTAGVSADAPYGEFTMNWSGHADGDVDLFGTGGALLEGMGFMDDHPLSEGYLEANGGRIRYKEFSMENEGNVSATFDANGDATGVYGEFAGFCDTEDNWRDVFAYYKFKTDKAN